MGDDEKKSTDKSTPLILFDFDETTPTVNTTPEQESPEVPTAAPILEPSTEKKRLRLSERVAASNPLRNEWWDFFDIYSSRNLPLRFDQHNHPKVKLAADTSFQEAKGRIERIVEDEHETLSSRTPVLFSASVGGGDDVLSLYAAAAKAQPRDAPVPIVGLFHDVSDWKLDYLAVRAYLAAASENPKTYLDALLMAQTHYEADPTATLDEQLRTILESKRTPPTSEQHKKHLLKHLAILQMPFAERSRVEQSVDRLVQLLHWTRDNKRVNYKSLAEELEENIIINGASNGESAHWLLTGFDAIKDSVRDGNLRFMQVNIDSEEGRQRYERVIEEAKIQKKNRLFMALHQASEKFQHAEDVAKTYAHFLSTQPTDEPGVDHAWAVDNPERVFHGPSIENTAGGLSVEDLENLRMQRSIRTQRTIKPDHGMSIIAFGDLLIGSPGYTEKTKKLMSYARKISRDFETDAIALVGSPFDGLPMTRKQQMAEYSAQSVFRGIDAQLTEAARLLNGFRGKRYAVSTEQVLFWVRHHHAERYKEEMDGIIGEGIHRHYSFDKLSPRQVQEIQATIREEIADRLAPKDRSNEEKKGPTYTQTTLGFEELAENPPKGNTTADTISPSDLDSIVEVRMEEIRANGITLHTDWSGMSRKERTELRTRIWTEEYFKAIEECYRTISAKLRLDEPLMDKLKLDFKNLLVELVHKRPSQYNSLHTGPGTVLKDQKLHNQRAARQGTRVGLDSQLVITGHDMDLIAQVHDINSMQLAVPSAVDIDGYEILPEETRRDLWSMPYKSISTKAKIPDIGATFIEYTDDGRYYFMPMLYDFLPKVITNPNVPEKRRTIVTVADSQIGSLANKHYPEGFFKALDYVFHALPETMKTEDGTPIDFKVIVDGNGDALESHNYPAAPLRNTDNEISGQARVFLEMCAPYFETKDEHGRARLNPMIEQMLLGPGNHELNSTRKEQVFNGMDMIYAYYRGLARATYGTDRETMHKFMPYSRFFQVEREGHKEELFNLMAVYTEILGYGVLGMHFFETGSPNGNDFTVPMRNFIDRSGVNSKHINVLRQYHYHSFGLGTHAGKLLAQEAAATAMSDYEYARGLSTKYQITLTHFSNKRMPVVEVLTNRFLDKYKLRNPVFQETSPKELMTKIREEVYEPTLLYS